MKALCFALFACAFNLLIGYVGLLSFGHALFFGWASYVSAYTAKVWGLPPELAILAGTAAGAGLGLIVGLLAIRRQGIYFAMITLALGADDVLLRRAGAVHGRRGRHPGGAARQVVRLHQSRRAAQHVFHRARHLSRLFPADLPHHQFAVRRGAQGDPRERAARDLARLPHRPLQTHGFRAVGHVRRHGGRDQGAGVSARFADRRRLDHVGRSRADDAGRAGSAPSSDRSRAPSSWSPWRTT